VKISLIRFLGIARFHTTRLTPDGKSTRITRLRPQDTITPTPTRRKSCGTQLALCLRSSPQTQHRIRARSPVASQAQSPGICRKERKVTPGSPFAAPGPMDGVGSLGCRQNGARQRRTDGWRSRPVSLVLAVNELGFCHRYYGLLRLPNARPEFLRVVRSSLGTCHLRIYVARDRPGGVAALSSGSFDVAVNSHGVATPY